jgi:hypothetical protein
MLLGCIYVWSGYASAKPLRDLMRRWESMLNATAMWLATVMWKSVWPSDPSTCQIVRRLPARNGKICGNR